MNNLPFPIHFRVFNTLEKKLSELKRENKKKMLENCTLFCFFLSFQGHTQLVRSHSICCLQSTDIFNVEKNKILFHGYEFTTKQLKPPSYSVLLKYQILF